MKFGGKQADGFVGFFGSFEGSADIVAFPVQLNPSNVCAALFDKSYALIAGSVVSLFSPVAVVFRWCGFAKICPAVIRVLFVNVIDFLGREISRHPQPNDPMGEVLPSFDTDFGSSLIVGESGDSSYATARRARHPPNQVSSFWVIIEEFFNELLRKIVVRVLVPHAVSYSNDR